MLANWIKETTSTTGTGAITLGGAPSGYITFATRFANGSSVQYTIVDGNNRECGIGTYNAGVLTRATKLEKLEGGTYSANPATGINLSGSAVVMCTGDASFLPYLHPTTQELRPGKVRILTPTGTNDHTRINAATDGFVGRVILAPGNWAIAGTVYMRPYCYIEGCGINATILTPVGTITMFGFDSTAQGYGANQQSCGLSNMTLYGYSNASKAIDTKMSTYAMQDVVIERVYFDGFGDGLGSSSTPVVDILDPWGLRFENCIIEQTGPRPAMQITNNSTSVNGAMVSRLKCKNNAGDGLILSGCESVMIDTCEFYGNTAATKNLQLSGGKLNIVRGCAFEYGAADGIRLLNSSQGNTIHACTLIGNGSTSQYGIYADTGSSANSIVGCTVLNYSTANLTDNNAAGSNRWVGVYNGSSFVDA